MVLSKAVTEIQSYTFDGCSSLKEVVVPESVKRIEKRAFEWCESLLEIKVPIDCEVEEGAFPASTKVVRY